MKITVAFFDKKREKKIYKRIINNQKNINKESEKNNINSFHILIILIISIVIVFNNTNIICFATNISKFGNLNITREDIIGMNGIANINNYTYTQIKPKEEIKLEESVPKEFIAMDELINEYKEQMVFKNVTTNDINIIAENSTYQKINVCGVDIINYSTNRNIDFAAILNSEASVFKKNIDEVLLYTTHTSESYANSDKYKFEYTSPRRTTDGRYNMLEISSTFASNLNNKGINTICSLTPHDYGEYNSAYTNSRRTITSLLETNSNISMVIDVHRDAIEDLDFAPKTNLKGYEVASLMFVMGIGYDGEENPYYAKNLKLALELQMLANKIYPGLFRTMIIRNSIYNQDLKENSFLVEVGASGNTIDEAKIATRCLANLLNLAFKD